MSLLLDALKKAADDKSQKSKTNDDKTIIEADAQENSAKSLELDLDLKTTDEDYPQVNEATISNNPTHPVDSKFDISERLYSVESDIKEAPLNAKLSLEEIDSNEKPENTKALNQNRNIDENISIKDSDPDLEPDNKNSHSQAKKNQTRKNQTGQNQTGQNTSRIETEQALSALIHKSNQYSRREQLKKNISLAILAGIILVASGLYFYIEMQTTSQDFYLTQNDSALITPPNNTQALPTSSVEVISEKITSPTPDKIPAKKPVSTQKTIKPATTKITKIKPPKSPAASTVKPITILHTKKADPIHLLISDAYEAFHAGNYRQSEKLYKQVLNRETKNRDALLGLAAIGIKENRYEYSRQKYQYLLRLDPTDSFAIAGLSGIENHIDSQLSESQLKFMLKQNPDAAHLYFALGTQYSTQLKWPEAQSAFFSAWSADNKNADYSYNLAVSLDHLDKKKQALNFYKLSLKLKQQSNGNFSQADTEQRIRRLQVSTQ